MLTLVGQKKTALVGRNRKELSKISGFLISKPNLTRGVSVLAKETKTLLHNTLKQAGAGAGLTVLFHTYIGCDIINQVGVNTQIL